MSTDSRNDAYVQAIMNKSRVKTEHMVNTNRSAYVNVLNRQSEIDNFWVDQEQNVEYDKRIRATREQMSSARRSAMSTFMK
jgi:HSP90 family molecular chaperone